MPWVSIIIWLISFLMSKSSGASNGKAALTATAAGVAAYYTVDPANKDNVLGVTYGDKTETGSTSETSGDAAQTSGLASVGKTAVSEAGSTLRSWGPKGTLGVVAGVAAASSLSSSPTKWWPWIAGGAAIYFINRRKRGSSEN